MAGHFFEPVRGKRSHDKIVAAHRVKRINQLATCDTETLPSPAMRTRRTRLLIGFQTLGSAISSEQERDFEYTGAVFQERQIEAHQVVILDRIGVTLANKRTERVDQLRLFFR